jgi:GTP-binding protein
MKGVVAIVGRPNVGKSTLFNRLIGERKAIVDDMPGVTRDRNYGTCEWSGREFTVIDTGGYLPDTPDIFEKAIREQVKIAIEEADVILFMVDVHDGLHPFDYDIAQLLRTYHSKKIIIVVNKVDNHVFFQSIHEFYQLGFENIIPIASNSGFGVGDLLDEILQKLPNEDDNKENLLNIPKLAFVGRPNVGKSSLVNAILDKNQNIVTPIAGTTRDAIYTRYKAFGFDFYLVDTAGLRKKAQVKEQIEFYSVIRTVKAIDECDIALLMLDATQGIESQDLKILDLIVSRKKGLIILVNKWDLVEKTKNIDKEYKELILQRIAPLSHIPILFISATEKLRIYKALQKAVDVMKMKNLKIPTHELNETLLPIIKETPPPSYRGHLIKIKFITQTDGRCPTFAFYCNYPEHVPTHYKRFLENKIREKYSFEGWPITIVTREK